MLYQHWEEYLKAEVSGDKTRWQKALQIFIEAMKQTDPGSRLAWLRQNVPEFNKAKLRIRMPLVVEVVLPTLCEAVKANNLDMIIFALHLHKSFSKQLDRTDLDWNKLVKRGLALDSRNPIILELLYNRAARYLDFTVHEIPSGVLWDMNGASIDQCQELLEYLEEFQGYSKALAKDDRLFIAYCRWHYENYRIYLARRSEFSGYASYIDSVDGPKERPGRT